MFSKITLKEKEIFLSSLHTLMYAGVGINNALESILDNTSNKHLSRKISVIKLYVEQGNTLSSAFYKSRMFDTSIISLIKVGEDIGKLNYFIKIAINNLIRRETLNSKIKSALIYPVFVLTTSFIVIVFISIFLFPKIFKLYSDLRVPLPPILRSIVYVSHIDTYIILLIFSVFLIFFISLIYFLFFFSKTKYIGESLLLKTPIASNIIVSTETAKAGLYISEMLKAGVSIYDIFSLLANSSEMSIYKKYYQSIANKISAGHSFEKILKDDKQNFFNQNIKNLIISGERSGNLEKIFYKIGKEALVDVKNQTKNLYSLLEPVLLVIIWLVVLVISVSVIFPIYNLFGQITNSGNNQVISTPSESNQTQVTITPMVSVPSSTIEIKVNKQSVKILKTPTGYLNVRELPNTSSKIIFKVLPGFDYELISENNDWYEIKIIDSEKEITGYVNKSYAAKY